MSRLKFFYLGLLNPVPPKKNVVSQQMVENITGPFGHEDELLPGFQEAGFFHPSRWAPYAIGIHPYPHQEVMRKS